MAEVATKTITRARKIKLSDDKKANVSVFACSRLNKAVNSIRVLGQCYGANYDWSNEQLEIVETELFKAVEKAMNQLTAGSAVAVAGISLGK